jgi:16S rRNA (guanine527-N7)-methyltransferase
VRPPEDIFRAFPAVSRESWERLQVFADRLLAWQSKVNLIAPSTVPELWTRHMADSLQLLALLGPAPQKVADLGSGGGFPGLVLACCGHEVHLYESVGKKVAFLREVLMASGSKGRVHQGRLEAAQIEPGISIVTARALASLQQLLALAQPFLAQGGHQRGFFHKGEDVDIELTQALKSWRFQFRKHPSLTDSKAVILEVWELEYLG